MAKANVATAKELHTVKEFCAAVRISERQYYRMRSEGDGPLVTILGGKHMVTEHERVRWIAAHRERQWINV